MWYLLSYAIVTLQKNNITINMNDFFKSIRKHHAIVNICLPSNYTKILLFNKLTVFSQKEIVPCSFIFIFKKTQISIDKVSSTSMIISISYTDYL